MRNVLNDLRIVPTNDLSAKLCKYIMTISNISEEFQKSYASSLVGYVLE